MHAERPDPEFHSNTASALIGARAEATLDGQAVDWRVPIAVLAGQMQLHDRGRRHSTSARRGWRTA